MRAENVSEYFFRLVSKQIDSLAVDGAELVYVRTVEHLDDKHVTRVVCEEANGVIHEFLYAPGSEDQTILHQVIDDTH